MGQFVSRYAQAAEWYRLNCAGLSMQEIADREGGAITKNAVIGAVTRYRRRHKLPIPERKSNGARNTRPDTHPLGPPNSAYNPYVARPRKQRPARATSFTPGITVPSFEAQIDGNTCRHIGGDRKDGTAVYCGHERAKPSMYCDGHAEICSVGLQIRADLR
jgi:hypothetical protein